jgi:transcriptional regulator with XRE-family HTH domain
MTFGQFVKNRRIESNQTLRAFCQRYGYDPGNHSKIERGIFNPPDDDRWMKQMAESLGIKQQSGEWFEFYNLANIARQQIPKVLLNDAEVVAKLPVLFSTLEGEPLPEEKLDELIDFIRSRQ